MSVTTYSYLQYINNSTVQTTRYHNRHPILPFNTRPLNCGTLVLNAFQEHFFVIFLFIFFFLWHLIGRYRVINRITHTQRFWLDQSIISPRFRCRSSVRKPFRQQKYVTYFTVQPRDIKSTGPHTSPFQMRLLTVQSFQLQFNHVC